MDNNGGSRIVERGVKYIYDEKKEERERIDRPIDRSAFFLADGNGIRDRGREEEGCSSWKQLPDTRNEHVMQLIELVLLVRRCRSGTGRALSFVYFSLICLKQYLFYF